MIEMIFITCSTHLKIFLWINQIKFVQTYVTTLLGIMPFRVLVRAEFTQRGSLFHRERDCSPALTCTALRRKCVTAGRLRVASSSLATNGAPPGSMSERGASVTPKSIGVRNTNGYILAVRPDIVRFPNKLSISWCCL